MENVVIGNKNSKDFLIKSIFFFSLVLLLLFYVKVGIPALSPHPELRYIEIMKEEFKWTFTLFAQFIFPIYLIYRFVIRKGLRFDLLATIGAIAILGMTRRYPIVDALMIVIVGLNFVGYRWKPRIIIGAFLFLIILFILMNYTRSREFYIGLSFFEIARSQAVDIIRRLFISQGTAAVLAIQSIPYEYDFFQGFTYLDHIMAVVNRTPPDISLGKLLFQERFFRIHEIQGEGYLPPTFIGEAFMNFGLYSFVFMAAIGALIQAIYIIFIRTKKLEVEFVLFSVFTTYFGRSAILGLSAFLINFTYFVLVYLSIVVITDVILKGTIPVAIQNK
jgi:hypothetical protein